MVTRTTEARTVGDRITLTVGITATTAATPLDSDVTYIVNPPVGDPVVVTSTGSSATGGSTSITRDSTGVYSHIFDATGAGDYTWAFRSTGTIIASTGGRIAVKALAAST